MQNIINSVNNLDNNLRTLQQANNNRQYSTNPIEENGINGEIDEPIVQGDYLDCWLISGILSMSYTDAGAEIIRDSITQNSDGSVDISFGNSNDTYNVTAEELETNNYPLNTDHIDYSTGDDDMLALELGVEKMIDDKNINKYSMETGGNPYYVFQMFDAESISVTHSQEEIEAAFDYFEQHSDICSMTLGTIGNAIPGLRADHGYAIKSIDGDNVQLVDPWDTTLEVNISRETLLEYYRNVSIVYAEF
ncbi:hypothetical protein IJ182_10315 [bacterium]|nr:hypothetical protein [bacterium]